MLYQVSGAAQWTEPAGSGVALAAERAILVDNGDGTWSFASSGTAVAEMVEATPGTGIFDTVVLGSASTLRRAAAVRMGTTTHVVPPVDELLFSYAPGDLLPPSGFTRAAAASYTAEMADLVFSYAPGTSGGTFARSSVATFTVEA